MTSKQKLKRPIASFILLTNIIFWPLFLLVGITSILGLPAVVFDIMLCISSWSSTFAFIILFKRIYPEENFMPFVKDKFKNKIRLSVILTVIMIQALVFLITLFIILSKNNEAGSIFTISTLGMLIYFFIKNLFAGSLGEEIGWRSFALIELQKEHSPLKASIIIGFWWGMWHLPIWFTTGFVGLDLIQYIVLFMILIISVQIIMTAFYNLNENLIIPIMIHQFFNFFIGILNGNVVDLILYNAILYSIVAVVLIVLNPKKVLYR
ncbi:type II CAAX endopeptidase family protein [Paenibacillus sp. JCM 10914]|uniref:type II CAAX endopeptidase family protein n=1 Tax=Paenibacillus sp. JCM 10914 TaxID=1236974 RepID=UPI0003CC7C2B|nr:type II CAAX endopeptidase family protein [Paenibacillus sp. JCM 10914]GAE06266.1 CAAX amino terminal protease family protein [Paenibacillus sp. JCM 10914]